MMVLEKSALRPCASVRVPSSKICSNSSQSPNTDGIDPESCKNVNIIGNHVHVGDDCIALKSSKLFLGMKLHIPCENVIIRNDSKKLTEKRRDALFEEITNRALAYKIVFITPQEIDERNILWATMDGMAQAVAGLEITPDYVLIDGNRCPPGLIQPAEAVVKGDANSASIAAASILAKVSRDRYMLELDKQYPQYQLAKHKGYPTKLHYELIAQYGIQPLYRRSFLKKQGYWHD